MKINYLFNHKKKFTFLLILFFFAYFTATATNYYLKNASVSQASKVSSWNTDPTGGGIGTNATKFTSNGDNFYTISGQSATFASNVTFGNSGGSGAGVTLNIVAGSTATINNNIVISFKGKNYNSELIIAGTIIFKGTKANQVNFTNGGNCTVSCTLSSGATLKTVNTNGITGNKCSIASAGTGINVNLSTEANYEFNGAGNQSITGLPSTVNNLTLSGTASVTADMPLSISGNLLIGNGTTFNASTFSHNIGGNFTNNGTFTQGTSSINLNGTTQQTINGSGSIAFDTLKCNNTAGVTLGKAVTITTLSVADDTPNSIFNDGGFTISTATTCNLNSGTYNCTASSFPWNTLNEETGTVNYGLEGGQTCKPATYYNLILSGSGTKTFATAPTVTNKYILEGSAVSSQAPTYNGAVTLEYKGNTSQITGNELPYSFTGNVIINNSNGVSLGNTSSISGNLDITNGVLTVGPDKNLTIGGTTTLANPESLILQSNATGTASFIDNGISGTGTAIVEKYLSNTNAYGWLISAPVTTAGINVFSGSEGVYYYNPIKPGGHGWSEFTTGNMETMRGYVTRFTDNKTLSFLSALNSGSTTFTNLYRTAFQSGNYGWNLLGNPYPSGIQWDNVVELNGGYDNDAFTANTKLNPPVYISNNNGNYLSYNNGAGSPGFDDGIIPPATAFWIQVNKNFIDANNPIFGASLTLNNSVRQHKSNGSKSTHFDIINLSLSNYDFNDVLVIPLRNDANIQFDQNYDAIKMFSENNDYPQIYALTQNNEKLSIKAIPDNYNETIFLPLGFTNTTNSTLTISVNDLSAFNQNLSIYIEDKVENKLINLKNENTYTFNSSSNIDNSRFFLIIGSSANSISDNNVIENCMVYSFENSIYIKQPSEPMLCVIYNILGQEIKKITLTQESIQKIDTQLTTGTYIVTLIGKEKMISRKIFIE